MEHLVLKRTLGLLGGNGGIQKVVELELLLDDADGSMYGINQQQRNTADKEIHYIVESDSSSDELDFGTVGEENETICLLSDDSSGNDCNMETILQQNVPDLNLTAAAVSSIQERSKRIVMDGDVRLDESECEIVNLLPDDSDELDFGTVVEEDETINLVSEDSTGDGCNVETVSKENVTCSNLTATAVNSVQKHSKKIAMGDEIGLVETKQEIIINLLSDDSNDSINMEINDDDESVSYESCSVTIPNNKMKAASVNNVQELTDEDVDDHIELIEHVNEIVGPSLDDLDSDPSSPVPKKNHKTSSNTLHHPNPSVAYDYFSCCLIDELIECGFSQIIEGWCKMSDERRCEIIRHGRPFPKKNMSFPTYTESILKVLREDYTRLPWLTACLRIEKLFCWTCSVVYWKSIGFDPDMISRFGINSVIHHSRQPSHKFAEIIHETWLGELALNKTPAFLDRSPLGDGQFGIDSRTADDQQSSTEKQQLQTDHSFKKINFDELRKLIGTEVKLNVINEKSRGNIEQETKQQETATEQTATEPGTTTVSKETVAEAKIVFSAVDFLNIKKKASFNPSKTIFITDIRKKSRKRQHETPKTASKNSNNVQSQWDNVDTNKQPVDKVPQPGLASYSNIYEECIIDDSLDVAMTKVPLLPNLFSSVEGRFQSNSTKPSRKLESEPLHKNKLMPPSNPHIFCSMGIPGIKKYYKNDAGILSYVAVTDPRGISVQFEVPTQHPVGTMKCDNGYCKSPPKCIVKDLINNNFFSGNWTLEQRVQILKNGGPCPEINRKFSKYCRFEKDFGNKDNIMIHEGGHWLVASEKYGRVVCWPCLLFGKPWRYDIKFGSSLPRVLGHARSVSHKKCCFRYKAWVHKNVKTEPKINFKVSNYLLKCLIDVVCSTQNRINHTDMSAGDIFALLKLVTSQDTKLGRQLHEISKPVREVGCISSETSRPEDAKTVVSHFTKRITESIFIYMLSRITHELEHAKFVCLIFSRVRNQPWVSVVTRYVTRDGDVVERFIRSIKADSPLPCHILFVEVSKMIDELRWGEKLVGYTLDGAIIKSSEIWSFDFMMTSKFSTAKLFHYRAHDLRSSLLETLSEFTQIKVFCHHIYELSRFIVHNEDVLRLLMTMSIDCGFGDGPIPWDLSGLIVTTSHHYPAFVLLFDKIISHPDDWPSEIVFQASQFLDFFQSFDNRFFIAALSRILTCVKHFAESLSKGFDDVGLTKEVNDAINSLKEARLNFSCIFEFTKNTLVPQVVLLEAEASDGHYSGIYQDVIRLALDFMATKAELIRRWSLSECQLYDLIRFPSKEILCLNSFYLYRFTQTNIAFNTNVMARQLMSVQQNKNVFEPLKNDPMRMIKFLSDFDMLEEMSEYYKFLELILTVPMITTATSSNIRAIDRAPALLATKGSIDTADWIWINGDLLTTMKQKEDFHANVLSFNYLNNTPIVPQTVTDSIKMEHHLKMASKL